MSPFPEPGARHRPLHLTLLYLSVGALWILLFDHVLAEFVPLHMTRDDLHILHGWIFLLASGGFLLGSVASAHAYGSRARVALRAGESLLRSVGERSEAAFWCYDPDGRELLFVSPGAETVWGVPLEEIYRDPRAVLDRIDPEDLPRVVAALEGSGDTRVEVWIDRPDGERRRLRITSSAVYDEAPALVCVVGLAEDVTRARAVERRLKESEERFRSSFEQAAVGMAHLDRDGRWLRVNRRFCELTGYARDEILARTFQSITHPEDVDADVRRDRRLWRGDIPSYTREKRYIRKDGGVVWVHLTVAVARSEGGEPLYLVVVAEDITERKTAELALRESELRFEQLAANLPQVHWMVSLDTGEMLYVSPAYEDVWGRSLESLRRTPHSWTDAVHPDDRGRVVAAQQAAMREKARGRYDEVYRVIRPDGEVRWVRDRAFPVQDPDGGVHRVAGMAEDITAEKRQEARIRLLASAVDQATDGVIITGRDGTIEYANPSFERITGYAPAEVVGRNPRFLKSGKQDEDFYRSMWGTLIGGRSWHGRFENRRKDGTRYTQDAIITPIRSECGRVEHFVGVLRDVTRELDLEEQVRQAQKMEMVGLLAGGIAHDFNNVLTAIKGHAFLALEGLESGSAAEDIHEIVGAADLAHNLTRQLLTFSRQREAQPRIMDVAEVIRGAQGMLRRLIGEDVVMQVSVDPDVGHVRVDPTHMDQILVNLAVNAKDAMPDGGQLMIRAEPLDEATLRKETSRTDLRGSHVRITVADTGIGMDPETRERIFEPFFTTKPPGSGTGLGLSTVFGIVEQSGGCIEVESVCGEGTTFRIHLPLHDGPREASCISPVPDSSRHTGSGTILVVEDQAVVRAVVRKTLERAGYRVLEAADGEEALEILGADLSPVDLVVSDVVMPRMGGVQLVRRLDPLRPDVPVLLMSGYSADERSELEDLRDRAHYLEKPFEARELEDAVGRILGRGESMAASGG